MFARFISPFVLLGMALSAHPMGNFSVSHYTRLAPEGDRLTILYSLDLAEIPTFEISRDLTRGATLADVEQVVKQKMPEWVRSLKVSANGQPLVLAIDKIEAWAADGAGGMPVVRVAAHLSAPTPEVVSLKFEDPNFDGRAGWKEIVAVAGPQAKLIRSSTTSKDRSKALSEYPADPAVVPPQELKASLEWQSTAAPPELKREQEPTPSTAGGPQEQAPGTVQRGDFLSTLLSKTEIPFHLALLGIGMAFVLGAIHAMSPGHGKTIVAAYLVGSRGTIQHAAFLGGMVTFTHTISVFLLGLATLFLSRYILPEKIVPWLGAISGLSIVLIGLSLFRKRLAVLRGKDEPHHHHHDHSHEHHHDDGNLHHHHHMPQGEVSMAGLIALGVSGGLVPCPSALVLLLSAIALGRTGYGLLLLVAFSFGLAIVLMAIGAAVLYAKNLVPSSERLTGSAAFRWIPVFSAAVIVCVGVLMTGKSIGVF
jgi:ABC-type nickel/cobalt efflux system permease component RcnA